jgi:hypothetical protein
MSHHDLTLQRSDGVLLRLTGSCAFLARAIPTGRAFARPGTLLIRNIGRIADAAHLR